MINIYKTQINDIFNQYPETGDCIKSYAGFDASTGKNDFYIFIGTQKPNKLSERIARLQSASDYINKTNISSSVLTGDKYCPIRALLKLGYHLIRQNVGEPPIELTLATPKIDSLFIVQLHATNLGVTETVNDALAYLEDLKLEKVLVPYIADILKNERQFNFIQFPNRRKVAHVLMYYFMFVADCTIPILRQIKEEECSYCQRCDGRIRTYFPKYGGTQDFEENFINNKGAFETSTVWSLHYSPLPSEPVRSILRHCACDRVEQKDFLRVLKIIASAAQSNLHVIFTAITSLFWKQWPEYFIDTSVIINGATIEYHRDTTYRSKDQPITFTTKTSNPQSTAGGQIYSNILKTLTNLKIERNEIYSDFMYNY